MKTNFFNRRILYLMGNNLSSQETSLTRKISFIKNIFFVGYVILFALIPNSRFIIEHLNDTANVLVAFYAFPGYLAILTSYVSFAHNKVIINETFAQIEDIVEGEMGKIQSHLYDKTVKFSNKFVKYLVIIFIACLFACTFTFLTIDLILVLVNGEILTEKWYLPLLYM